MTAAIDHGSFVAGRSGTASSAERSIQIGIAPMRRRLRIEILYGEDLRDLASPAWWNASAGGSRAKHVTFN